MTTVCFVRHGETEANVTDRLQGQTDTPLDAAGLEQAERLALRLKDEEFDVILSSDLSRARVTAEKIAAGRPVTLVKELREWCFGSWQGMLLQEILRDYPEEFALFKSGSLEFQPPGGESALEFLARAENFMQTLARDYSGKRILCVSHGGFIKQTLKVVLGFKTFPALPACENTAISRYALKENGTWQLIQWNDASHLTSFNRSTGW